MVFFEVDTSYEVLSPPFWGVLYEEGINDDAGKYE